VERQEGVGGLSEGRNIGRKGREKDRDKQGLEELVQDQKSVCYRMGGLVSKETLKKKIREDGWHQEVNKTR